MNLTTGTALQSGRYILQNPLGQSALGITFRAIQAPSNQSVVLKTLRTQPQTDVLHLKRRFVEEARRFAQCQHPGLARVLEIFEESGLPFVVMDEVAGQSLAEAVRSHAPLPELEAIQYIRQAGSALNVMHRQGLLHRDVKPEHLMRPMGALFVVLVGFDPAHYAVLGVPETAESLSPYAALELAQQQVNLTAATDVYGLAATLYFLVTGQAPVAASRRHQATLIPPRQLQPTLSAAIERAILSGMALNPQERPQMIAAWFALLSDQQSLPTVPRVMTGGGQPRVMIDLPNTTAASNGSVPPTSPPTQAPLTSVPLASMPLSPTPLVPTPLISTPLASTTPQNNPVQPNYGIVPSPRRSVGSPSTKSRLPKALMMTAAIAIAFGGGLGLALRFSAAHGIGPTFFQTKQDFPPLQDWPLQASPAASSIAPVPDPPPMRSSLAPEPPVRVKLAPLPPPAPARPAPAPTATIEATPPPTLSPLPPVVPPSPQPSPPSLPTNPSPRPVPSIQSPTSPPG